MSVQVQSADFRRAIMTANRVIERRNTIPALSAVKCVANGSFQATATDLGTTIIATIARTPGDYSEFVLTNPREVATAVGSAGAETAVLSHADAKVSLSSGMLLITDGALSIDDFPAGVDRAPLEDFAATLGPDHMALMARVAGAASTEETRYYLTGVSVVPDGATGFKLRATNGHMLFVAALRCPDIRGKLASEIIIPRKTVNLLLQLASKAEDGVRLTVGRAPATNVASPDMGATDGVRISFAFTVPGMKIVLICKPIDGTYPDVTRVIPTAGHPQMLFKTAGLRRALGAVSGFCKATRAVKVELHDDDTATLSAAYIDKGLSTAVRIACQNRRPGFTVGFSGEYLGKILNAARGEEIVVDTADASSAALIRNPADPDWTGVLMPIRI